MVTLLAKLFIKNREDYKNPAVRQAYGVLCGAVGIFLNLCLFTGKFVAGLISNSIAITADAFNNLSDAGSSIITLIGFKMAGQKPDPDHPFGHGRIEYISGLLVSVIKGERPPGGTASPAGLLITDGDGGVIASCESVIISNTVYQKGSGCAAESFFQSLQSTCLGLGDINRLRHALHPN